MNRLQLFVLQSKPILFILVIFSFLALFSLSNLQSNTQPSKSLSLTNSNMGIIHIVLFEFKEEVTPEEVLDACNRMLALKDKCLHPTTNTPYVKTAMGGKNISPEGRSNGITYGFISEFENEEDRQYYINKDPAHSEFVKSLGPIAKQAQVVDFVPGVF